MGRLLPHRARTRLCEALELRTLLSAAADITQLTALRADPAYAGVDGSGVGVAVIDSGVFAAHPDLQNNFVAWFDAVTTPATAAPDTNIADAFDPDGHGTHVAGTATSTNPEIGVAPAADLVAIRGIPSEGDPAPQFDTVANALQWVLNHAQQLNIKVVNMSLGDYTTNFDFVPGGTRPAIFDELEQAGVTTVIASGNNYANFVTTGSSSPGVFGTLTVANTWPDNGPGESFPKLGGNGNQIDFVAVETDAAPDRIAATSQRSTLPNQVAAPGSGILSTWNDPNKLYNTLSGTSMASPLVAGTVALMQDAAFTFGGRYLTAGEVQSIVRDTADHIIDANVASNFRIPIGFDAQGRPFRSGPDQDLPETGLTFDRVNVYRAVQAVRQLVTGTTPNPDPTPDPTDQGDTNNTTASAIAVPALDATQNYSFRGRIGTDGSVQTGADDVDMYKVVLETPGNLMITSAVPSGGAAFDAFLRVFSADGTQMTVDDDSAGNLYPALQSGRLDPGTYYVGFSSVNNTNYDITTGGNKANGQSTGDYQFTVGVANADPNGVAQGALSVDLASPDRINPATQLPANFFAGNIGSDPNPADPSGPRVPIGDTDVDMFRVVAPDTGSLVVDVDARDVLGAAGVDSYVRLFDADLHQMGFNDDSGGGLDSFLRATVAAGQVYYVAVTTFGNAGFNPTDPFDRVSTTPGATGNYELYLSLDNGDTTGTIFEAVPSEIGSTETEAIGTDDGRSIGAGGGKKDVDFYEFTADDTAPAGSLLDVRAGSPDNSVSTVLGLWQFDAEKNDVVKILDTAGSDAHLIVPIDPGETFYVSVTGVGNNDFQWFARASGSGGDTGNYTLTSLLRPASDFAALTDNAIAAGTPSAVAPGDRVYRTIGADGGVTIGAADVDLYRFDASATGTVAVRATVPGEATTDPVLRVFDASGNEIAFDDDAASGVRDSLVNLSVNGGQTYYIGVNGSSASARAYDPETGANAAPGDGGDYVLELSGITPGDVTIPFGGKQKATYTDASGDVVVVSLKGPGTGTVRFAAGTTGNVDATGIVVDNATAASALLIKTGPAGTPIGDVQIGGSLKSLMGKTADLTGNLVASGSIAKLALRNAGGGKAIQFGGGGPATLTFASVSDLSVNSAAGIKAIKASQWLDTDAIADVISAPVVGSLAVAGGFGAGVMTGTLVRAKVGSLAGSDVRATDAIGTIAAGSVRDSRIFAGIRSDLTTLPDSADDFANASAVIRAVTVKGAFSNTLVAAPTVGKAALGSVSPTTNGGVVFGLAADRAQSVSAVTPAGRLRKARLDDPAASELLEDFAVRLI